MIESFFIWLLGPTLAAFVFIGGIIIAIFAAAAIAVNSDDILKYFENRCTKNKQEKL